MKRALSLFGGVLAAGFIAATPAMAQPYDHRPPPPHEERGREPPPPVHVPPPGSQPQQYRPPNSLGEGWRQQQDEVRQGVTQRRIMPLSTIVEEVRRRVGGRQLDAGLETGADGHPVWRVRWMTADGRRVDYMIDAANGRVLSGQ
jgi:Peptidase propeptide and YPEB domain